MSTKNSSEMIVPDENYLNPDHPDHPDHESHHVKFYSPF